MSFVVVIPARYASSRLPNKPLLDIGGKPMIQLVWEQAVKSSAKSVVIATDDERIKQAADNFGAECCMTAVDHTSGTDRLAEVVQKYNYEDKQIVVNLQGDEPLIEPKALDQVADDLAKHSDAVVSTLCQKINSKSEILDPNIVKVVLDHAGYALYFSRAMIPFDRDAPGNPAIKNYFSHIGLYAYRAGFLQQYQNWKPSPLEKIESLEQLRVLWYGYKIHLAVAAHNHAKGVDTEEDLQLVRKIYATIKP